MTVEEIRDWIDNLPSSEDDSLLLIKINGAYCEIKDVGVDKNGPTIYAGDEVP